MGFAPKHDWQWYDAVTLEFESARSQNVSPAERFERYEDYFQTIAQSKKGLVDSAQLEKRRWREKLRSRDKMVAALRALDEFKRGQNASTDPG